MIQPDANADSPNEVSAGKEALDAPLSSLPTDDVGDADEMYEIGKRDGYEAAIQDVDLLTGGDGEYRFCTDQDAERHTPDAATMKARIAERFQEAASTLFRLREERDEALGWRSDRQLALDNLLARALKAEDLNRKLVEGLEKIAGFVRQRPGGDRGSYQRGYDIGFNNAGVTAAEFARRSLLSSISGGEAAGEDGG